MAMKKFKFSLIAMLMAAGVMQTAHATIQDARTRQHGGWYIELEPFYARAKDTLLSTLPFANVIIDTFTPGVGDVSTSDSYLEHFRPDSQWGYRIALGYDYPSCNNCNYGYSLEYTYHKMSDDRNIGPFVEPLTGGGIAPAVGNFASFFAGLGTNMDASIDYKYHTLDLLAHKNHSWNCFDYQWFAGARYINLKEERKSHLYVPEDLADDFFDESIAVVDSVVDYNNKYDGLGPRVGFNAFYQIGCGFGITTEVAGNLLFGVSKSTYNEDFVSLDDDGLEVDSFLGTHHSKVRRDAHIVPGLSGKIGIAYRTVFCNCSSLIVELGYRGDKYFGIANDGALVHSIGSFEPVFSKDTLYHDFDMSGPYLNIAFHA